MDQFTDFFDNRYPGLPDSVIEAVWNQNNGSLENVILRLDEIQLEVRQMKLVKTKPTTEPEYLSDTQLKPLSNNQYPTTQDNYPTEHVRTTQPKYPPIPKRAHYNNNPNTEHISYPSTPPVPTGRGTPNQGNQNYYSSMNIPQNPYYGSRGPNGSPVVVGYNNRSTNSPVGYPAGIPSIPSNAPPLPSRTHLENPTDNSKLTSSYSSPLQHMIMNKVDDKPVLKAIAGAMTSVFGNATTSCADLLPEQVTSFVENGFLLVPNAVPMDKIKAAKRDINRFIARPTTKAQMKKYQKLSYGNHELMTSNSIRELFYGSDALAYVEALLGKHHPVWSGQIALRFPGYSCIEELVKDPEAGDKIGFMRLIMGKSSGELTPLPDFDRFWHIDGSPGGLDVRAGTFKNFSILLGVLLGDVEEEMAGNLTVFPGSHKIIQDYINRRGGARAVAQDLSLDEMRKDVNPLLPEAVQLTGNAGDIVLVHYQVAHTIAPNLSADIRYCVYFRLTSKLRPEKLEFRPEAMENIWIEFDGLRKFF
eukprot:TRINITY_DN12340_c0_g1_i1.p1 TRINITY_DN12340_c0_g1~~TRINITY_DN12340_c0_g1_i1.p1  ORF type:complete len:531 (-),score=105.11 TRINITY_DN12340_c0_g1_i1:37-1629(-)